MGALFFSHPFAAILSFFRDDGFLVIVYLAANPTLSSWDDFKCVGQDFDLMCDFVLKHISAQNVWFASYLDGRPGFSRLAIEVDPKTDISRVIRC